VTTTLARPGTRAEVWSDATLEGFRSAGDPLADELAGELHARGGWSALDATFASVTRNSTHVRDDAPADVRAYLIESARMPRWADAAVLEHAQALFARLGPWIMLALHCASLPYSYGAAKGVKVIYLTGKLQRERWKRLLTTAQFVVDVLSPGGFTPGGFAIRSAQKVRLVHAAVRMRLRHDPRWDHAWGTPINQEDLAGTVLCFSHVVLEALHAMGVSVTPDDADAYVHAWDVVGALLGLDPDLRAGTAEGAGRLARRIERRQLRPTVEGHDLVRSLVDYLERLIGMPGVPGVPASLIHRLLGERVARDLGIDPPWQDGSIRGAVASELVGRSMRVGARLTQRAFERSPLVARAPEVLGRRLLASLCRPAHGADRAPLRVDDGLRRGWGAGDRVLATSR